MDEQQRKQLIQNTFNTVAAGYDNAAMRFFQKAAQCLPGIFNFRGNEQVLDVATGTGRAALAMAPYVPQGKVTAIDFSAGMLKQAHANAGELNLKNVDFLQMDMQAMTFPDEHFDAANCSFGVFFVEDMEGQVKNMANKVKSGGTIVVCTFHDGAFHPLVERFYQNIEQYGVERPPLSWQRLGTEEKSAALFHVVGLQDIQVHRHDVGYYLQDATEWWDIIWNAGFRGLVEQLNPEQLEQFKGDHLVEIQDLANDEGIWLEIEVLFTEGRKRAQ